MAISAFKTFVAGEVLLASDLNSSYGVIISQVNTNTTDIATNTTNVATNTTNIATNTTNIATNTAALATGQNWGRNLIINGDFSVWQLGTSTFSTDEAHTADRWLLSKSGGTATIDQGSHTLGQTDVPGNPKYFLDLDIATGNNYAGTTYRVEGVDTTANREVTFSFYAKGVNPGGGTIGIRTDQIFGTGGSPSTGVGSDVDETLVLTASWQRFEVTFTPASISGKTLGTNGDDYFQIRISQGSDTSTDAWNIDIANVQLEFGDTATDFELVAPADQLARCQRYAYVIDAASTWVLGNGTSVSTTLADICINLPVQMRANPSIDIGVATVVLRGQSAAPAVSAISFNSGGSGCATFRATSSGLVNANHYALLATGKIIFNSEL